MNKAVMIKGNKSGIVLVLDKEISYEKLKKEVASKFKETAKFLGKANMALSFEGRELNDDQQKEILSIIEENSDLNIVCVVSKDEKLDQVFQKAVEKATTKDDDASTGQFYKGNLRSGQVLEVETSIVVIGDVNIGAKVVSKGNIIVLGHLKGNAYAGAGGNKNTFVLALGMEPIQIRIADFIARAPDKQGKSFKERSALFGRKKEKKLLSQENVQTQEMKIAFVEGDQILIEPVTKDVLNEINM